MSPNRSARLHTCIRRTALAGAFVIALSAAALAQEQPSAFTDPLPGGAVRPQNTRIEIDQQADVIRIVIDGAEVARFDAGGLHVRGDVNYGGSIADYGQAGFDDHAGKAGEDRDEP